MRLGGTAQAGYYPTPPSIVNFLMTRLELAEGVAALDPCCGAGDALGRLCAVLGAEGFGIELERERARAARQKLGEVRTGDALQHEARGFSLLYLNPPYDTDTGGQRLERRFLEHFTPSLVPGGVLVFIIPEGVVEECRELLEFEFARLGVWRFPPEEYVAYRQVIVTGMKRSSRSSFETLPEVQPLEAMPMLSLRGADEPYMRRAKMDEGELLEEVNASPLWADLWQKTAPPSSEFRPLHRVREGHLALLIAAGMLNGVSSNTGIADCW
ncbi:MAG: class I SAM-dependent methyltransferase [Pleurocapsa sp. SU_196_0]|nr:class I SAM-dependent methyltransferase [Pleurocapsa sp. SU_196_0]